MGNKGRMTVRQIAETAGVSRMTVSRVLNNSPGVADATRETVERVVARSGFVRSRAARALKGGRHGLIDLVVVSLGTDYVTQILRGFEAALEPTGYRLVISSRSNEDESERNWLNKISDGWTDGAALVLSAGQPARLEALRRLNVPLVVIDHEGGVGSDVPAVGATNWDGARAATEYLLSLGHRRIGMFRGPATYRCVAERVSGYRSAMETARPPWTKPGSGTAASTPGTATTRHWPCSTSPTRQRPFSPVTTFRRSAVTRPYGSEGSTCRTT